MLRTLSTSYKIGVIANQSVSSTERLTTWGLMPFISACLCSFELGLEKPDRRSSNWRWTGRALRRPKRCLWRIDPVDRHLMKVRSRKFALGLCPGGKWIRTFSSACSVCRSRLHQAMLF